MTIIYKLSSMFYSLWPKTSSWVSNVIRKVFIEVTETWGLLSYRHLYICKTCCPLLTISKNTGLRHQCTGFTFQCQKLHPSLTLFMWADQSLLYLLILWLNVGWILKVTNTEVAQHQQHTGGTSLTGIVLTPCSRSIYTVRFTHNICSVML